MIVSSAGVAETHRLGQRLGQFLAAGDIVALSGDLGTGKTELTRGIAAGAGASGAVTSPTFTFIHLYRGGVPIYHVDLYRIEAPRELDDLGLEDVLRESAVVIIEWAEKAGRYLPREHLGIGLRVAEGETARELEFRATGRRYEQLLQAFARGEDPRP